MTSKEKTLLKAFGNRITQIREKKGLSIRGAAFKCDMDHSALVRIEQGYKNVSLTTLKKLSQGLEVSMKQLVDFEV
jgi:transcriptional regulator with XRE-family HTH domain